MVQAAENVNNAIKEGNNVQSLLQIGSDAAVAAQRVSSKLQDQYKEVKWLLTNKSSEGAFVTQAHTLKEEVITP